MAPATSFPFQHQVEVEFRHLDPMGHVNNAMFFTYMETARIKFFLRFMAEEGTPLDLPLIVAQATCNYRSPAFFGEKLTIGLGISRFGQKSFDVVYRIEGEDGRLVADGKTVMVTFDYGQGTSIPVPETFRQRVLAYQREKPDFFEKSGF